MIEALAAATLCEAFQLTAARRADSVALRLKGDAERVTWNEYAERVRSIAGGLAALDVEHGQPVAIMLSNRPEFHMVDAGAMHLGAVPFSMYNTAAPDQLAHIVATSGARVIVTEAALAAKAMRLKDASPAIEHVVMVDGDGGTMTLAELEAGAAEDFDFEARWRAVAPDDLATLIYTSGTTGPPKCVQISHHSLLRQWAGLHEVFDITPGGRILSWLPAAHIADRLLGQYQQICFGHTVTCVPDPRELAAHLVDVRPTFWVAVPRIYEKFRAALEAKGITDPAALGEDAKHEVRAGLGLDQAEQFVVGASPIPVAVLEFFHALGMAVCEVWGMSELPIATANPPHAARLGSVGPPVPGVEVRLAADGEIQVRGPMVMQGYRNDPEKTAEVLDADGWYSTGDVGVIDDDGYVTIVDRKKELIISSTGKNMSPANIEAELKSASSLIGQAMAVGDGRSYNVALIVLDPDGVASHGAADLEDAVAHAVATANAQLSRPEQIKRHVILDEEWLPGGDELTPTSKLKRREISAKYAAQIDALYEGVTA